MNIFKEVAKRKQFTEVYSFSNAIFKMSCQSSTSFYDLRKQNQSLRYIITKWQCGELNLNLCDLRQGKGFKWIYNILMKKTSMRKLHLKNDYRL
jgi:transposase-like protein